MRKRDGLDRAEKQRTILQNDTEMILNQYLQISSQYIFLSRRDNYFPKEQMNVWYLTSKIQTKVVVVT